MKTVKTCLILLSIFMIQDLFSQEKTAYKITKLIDGIYELTIDGGGYPVKVIASVGNDGLLIVDSGDKSDGQVLVDALNTFGKGMPKIIINTHSHIEHLGGNTAIGKGPVIIGHKNLRDRYINGLYVFNGIPENALPNLTFSDTLSLFFNGEEIKLIAFTGAHDNSDIIAWFKKSKVVCTGALCGNHHFISVDGELGDIMKFPETVASVISILPEDAIIVPGHSDDCTLKEYREFSDMLVKTSGIVRSEISKGKSLAQLQNEEVLADWKGWESYTECSDWIQYWVWGIENPKKESTKQKVYAPIYHTIMQSGADSALSLYNNLKTKHADQYWFEERTSMWIGRRLAYIGRPDDAIRFLNRCIREYPDHEAASISHYSLGNIYWKSGDKKSAGEHYRKYLERFPNDKFILDRMKEAE